MANTKFEVILEMHFLKISNADVTFGEVTLMWKSYITIETLPITEQVQPLHPKEFVIAGLNADSKTFIVYMAIREQKEMAIDSDRKTYIKAQSQA